MRERSTGLRTSARAALVALGAAAVLSLAAAPAASQPTVTDVRLGDQGGATRLVLDLTEAVAFTVFALDNPYRIVIDLPVVYWGLAAGEGGRGRGVVARYRFGRFDDDTSRVVLDLEAPAVVTNAFLLPPGAVSRYRLVLDLQPVNAAGFVADAPPPQVTAPSVEIAAVRPRGKIVVALDPGHGGVDPGALGVTGTREKDITLAISMELRDALEATGRYAVVLTRERDRFVALRERVAIARRAGAELFLSLHADSLDSPNVRGASVYTLSETASDKEAADLAAKENRADAIGGLDLRGQDDDVAAILISLAQRETMNLSATFANVLIPEFAANWRLLRNTHRFAGFAVLKAPDVPSVLVELGYLSNARDESALNSPSARRPIIAAVVRAVDEYFGALPG
ncbi:MAG: N-acetylmuramoyl-L-alanine amidase [Proteobacteria bacterium]|nr:N-acetylmuramoyl-L-alanine amidase [Pseudomonadota bacterium]MDA1131616.1 N-acetylmuramoyl-L-alanine amidase [Pseudomonadota bacterium]